MSKKEDEIDNDIQLGRLLDFSVLRRFTNFNKIVCMHYEISIE